MTHQFGNRRPDPWEDFGWRYEPLLTKQPDTTGSESQATTPISQAASPSAAWYDDPHDPNLFRYWDGAAWTAHTAPKHPNR